MIVSFSTNVDMKLSEFEVQVLHLFWNNANASAPEIHIEISKVKNVTYSTVKTIIDRLEKKQAIMRSHQKGRTIYYKTLVSAEDLQTPMVDNFISKVFSGNKRALLNHLFKQDNLSNDDIYYIENLLKENKEGQ